MIGSLHAWRQGLHLVKSMGRAQEDPTQRPGRAQLYKMLIT